MKNSYHKILLTTLLTFWIIFSAGYILFDLWKDFRDVLLQNTYMQGKTDAINTFISEAEKCEPFSVYSGDKSAEVIDIKCSNVKIENEMLQREN